LIWFQVPSVQGTVFSSDGKALVRALDGKGRPTCLPMAGVDVLRRANQQRENGAEQPLPHPLASNEQTEGRGLRVLEQGGLEVWGGSHVVELLKVRKCHGETYWQGPVVCRYQGFIGHSSNKGE
jgi:hypothetical protein